MDAKEASGLKKSISERGRNSWSGFRLRPILWEPTSCWFTHRLDGYRTAHKPRCNLSPHGQNNCRRPSADLRHHWPNPRSSVWYGCHKGGGWRHGSRSHLLLETCSDGDLSEKMDYFLTSFSLKPVSRVDIDFTTFLAAFAFIAYEICKFASVLHFRESHSPVTYIARHVLPWFTSPCVVLSVPVQHHDIYNAFLAFSCWLEPL